MTENEIRTAAHSLYSNQHLHQQQQQQHLQNPYNSNNAGNSRQYSTVDLATRSQQSHSINMLSEDFIAGYMEDGRMSVIRRFFCLFVTFDLFFISLLWIICVMITGDNIMHALKTQVVHYSIYTSLFDVVMAAICRFLVLISFYGLLYINHWLVIALSTTGSCGFLVSKVFVYNWTATQQPVFEVLLVVISFVIAWGEAWFLDCRVIPQERYARNYYVAVTTPNTVDRAPLLSAFLSSAVSGRTESFGNFYSPYESIHNSDDEDDEQDDEFKRMGIDCVQKAYNLLESEDWKIEKVTSKGDTIQSCQQDNVGKVYKLTAKIHYPAKKLLQELYYKIEEVPQWNPTLLESKIIRKIDSHTDISYTATVGGGGGIVKCRDFVNLRCWQLCRDGKVIEGVDLNSEHISHLPPVPEHEDEDSDDECIINNRTQLISQSCTELTLAKCSISDDKPPAFETLSKSLGANIFQSSVDPDEDQMYSDALAEPNNDPDVKPKIETNNSNVYITAAFSIDYPGAPFSQKYIRGENKVSCWAMREIENQKDYCIFEWLLCLDLKGYVPKYVLDTAYTKLMQDYMLYLRKYVAELRKQGKVPPSSIKS